MKTLIAKALEKAWPALRPALVTAGFTFLAIFGGALTSWLQDLSGFLSDWVETPEAAEFPDPSVLGSAFVAAISAAAAGLVNFVVRYVQILTGKGTVPTYEKLA